MAQRTVTGSAEQWQRVAERIIERRNELNLIQADVVERANRALSTSVISLLENAKQDTYAVRTLQGLALALDWKPGSIERILNGGAPVPLEPVAENRDSYRTALEVAEAKLEDGRFDELTEGEQELLDGHADVRSIEAREQWHWEIERRLAALEEQIGRLVPSPKLQAATEGNPPAAIDEASETHPGGADEEPGPP